MTEQEDGQARLDALAQIPQEIFCKHVCGTSTYPKEIGERIAEDGVGLAIWKYVFDDAHKTARKAATLLALDEAREADSSIDEDGLLRDMLAAPSGE